MAQVSRLCERNGLAKALCLAAGLLLLALLVLPSEAVSQAALPGSAQPGRAEEPVRVRPLTPRSSEGVLIQQQDPGAEIPDVDLTLTLERVIVEGSTVFSQAELDALSAEFIGQEIPVSTIFEIARRATVLYRDRGFILSQVIVPPQEIDGGTVRLQAVEGFVDKVVVTGDLTGWRNLVEVYTSKIAAERPLTAATLERYLLLAGDLAGMEVRGVFSPSEDTPGAATLTVEAKLDRVEGAFEVANDGSNFVGPNIGSADLFLNSLFGLHERLALRGATSADLEELVFGEIIASIPIGSEGTSVFARLSGSESEPGSSLDPFDITNEGIRWALGVTHPIIRSRRRNLFVGLQFDWDDLQSDSDVFGRLSDDNLRVVRATADFDFVDAWLGGSRPAVTAIRVRVSQGFDALGATNSNSRFRSRVNADGTFTALDTEILRYQRIGIPGVTVLLAARGQITSEAVLASEEFGFGGSDYGRGYDPSSILGDRGVAGKIELQYNRPVDETIPLLQDFELFGFLDAGLVQNIDVAGPVSTDIDELYSVGGGVRLGFDHGFESEVLLAWRGMTTSSVENLGADRLRALFRVVKRF